MVTKRKQHKLRDADDTKRDLLKTIGEILRTEGHAGLRVNNVARRLGKDKKLIRYYFESLNNLEKAYILENDYWVPFFERFRLDAGASDEEVKTMFVELMQENFRFFGTTAEMQKIILWQISEPNPLMRTISESREKEGAKLTALTDNHFKNSDVNFRAVLALLLGGSYYILLHAATNKSTVSGIDANRERDREAIIKTIKQIIEWAWEHETKKK